MAGSWRGTSELGDIQPSGTPNGEAAVSADPAAEHVDHVVLFYESSDDFIQTVADYAREGLDSGESVLVILTREHRAALAAAMASRGVDVRSAELASRWIEVDVSDALRVITDGGRVDPHRFREFVVPLLNAASVGSRRPRIAAEIIAMIAAQGRLQSALDLERQWELLLRESPAMLFCGYPIECFGCDADADFFAGICDTHRRVLPGASFRTLDTADKQLREVSNLQRRAAALKIEIQHRRRGQAELDLLNADLERRIADTARRLDQAHRRRFYHERALALGALARGIGHDLGNILMPLRMRLDLIESRVGPELRDDVAAVRDVADHLRRLTSGLRLLTADPDAASAGAATDLAEWADSIAPLVRAVAARNISLSIDVAPGLPPVAVTPGRLAEMIFALLHNAAEASDKRAAATIALRAQPGPSPEIVLLTVSDNGAGMSPEVLQRCTEPFFSTKAAHGSTGLGLASVRSTVESLGGQMAVESRLGAGTAITLRLPVADHRQQPVAATSRQGAH